jgi:tubulin-specific chaperone A
MPAPSKLVIASNSLQRLIKEEASYHKEQLQQQDRITKLEGDSTDENAEFLLRQEVFGSFKHIVRV